MLSNRSKFVFYDSYDTAFHNLVKIIIEHLPVLRYAQNCSCENRIFPNPADLPYSAFSRVIFGDASAEGTSPIRFIQFDKTPNG